ncbi:DUF4136 domain-containing protein [Spongiibacter sp.]|uniref:DUF4136 domain-containing protein n=1 Tax=Spongiibacter sp. TaxID=2024860 RepID=UPI003561AEA2
MLALLQACNGIPVSHDYALDYDFSSVTSYAWLPAPAVVDPAYDALMHQRYREAIEAQLQGRGLRKVDAAQAAVLLSYHVGAVDKARIESVGGWYSHFGYYPCYHCEFRPGFGHMHFHDSDLWIREYTEDRVLIDMVEPGSRRLLWRGSARRVQPALADPVARRAYIEETVGSILQQFPPGRAVQ